VIFPEINYDMVEAIRMDINPSSPPRTMSQRSALLRALGSVPGDENRSSRGSKWVNQHPERL